MKQRLFIGCLLLVSLSSACRPTYQSVTTGDGMTYYAYRCENFYECLQGVYDKCPQSYDVITSPVVPLMPGKTPMQIYAPGSGEDQIVFRCKAAEVPALMAQVRDGIREVESNLRR